MNYSRVYEESLLSAASDVKGLDKIKGSTVMVTGATGLIGSAVADLLAAAGRSEDDRQQEAGAVRVLAACRDEEKFRERFGGSGNNKNIEFVHYDAQETVELATVPDYIIHCAGNSHPESFRKEPAETLIGSITGLDNLFKFARKNKRIKRILYVSSSEVYGSRKGSELYKEDDYCYLDFLNSRACYPSGKRAAETLCSCYIEEYGMDAVVVRPGHVYGPTQTASDSRAASQFFRDVMQGKDIVMKSSGMQLRSYCHVLDCASAILTVLLEGACGEAYNISNPDSVVTIRDMAECIAGCAGRRVIFQEAGEAEKKGFNFMSCSALDAGKLLKLGWKGRYPMRDGVQNTLDCLKSNKKQKENLQNHIVV